MKKVVSILLCFLMLFGVVSCGESDGITGPVNDVVATSTQQLDSAPDTMEESSGLAFVSNGDGTCYVSGIGSCIDNNIIFPKVSPDGDIVTSIANHAFCATGTLESVVISETITRIGAYAFSECANLSNVILSDSVVILEQSAFSACEKLESVTMSRNIVDIEDYTFYECKSLKSITLHRSTYSIGYKAFGQCSSLENLSIPDRVKVIEGYAFAGCDKLTSMTIPKSVTEISGGIFAGCDNLTHISVESGNAIYKCVNNCIIRDNEVVAVCNGFTIPSDAAITSIGECAISHVNAASIIIPQNITNFDFSAFIGCKNLIDVFYGGSQDDWNAVVKDQHWYLNNSECSIHYAK